jgi:two-component system response regulator BaeR
MIKKTILIVEDDLDIADVLAMYLQAADYNTKIFNKGTGVVEWVQSNHPSLILLDIDLPGKNGHIICKEVRDFSDMPIIMTTAKVEEVDRLIGLDIGADDYVCKPYSVKEVVARVKANLRRLSFEQNKSACLKVDLKNSKVGYQDITVALTTVEFSLFNLLYSNANRIYARAQIMDLVYKDYRDISDRTVDSHIRNLRKKLSVLTIKNDLIRSIYGVGYKFEPI